MADDVSPLDRWKWAATVPVTRPVDRAVLCVLAEAANRRTVKVNRGLRRLQGPISSRSRSTLLQSLERLVAAGRLSIEKGRGSKESVYTLHIDLANLSKTGPLDDPGKGLAVQKLNHWRSRNWTETWLFSG